MRMTANRLAWACSVCVSLIVGCPLFLVTGCKPSQEKIAAREALLNQEIEALFQRVQELKASSQTDEAMQLVEKGLATPKYKGQKARFFGLKIDLLLARNNDKAACDLVLQTWKSEPELARAVVGNIYSYYEQRKSHAGIHQWCKSLLTIGADLPADLRVQVLKWQLSSALAMSDETVVVADLDAVIATLKLQEAVTILQEALGGLIDGGRHEFASALIRHLDAKKIDSPLYRNLLVVLSARCALAAKDWEKMAPIFKAGVTQLPDDQLAKLSRAVLPALQKNGRTDLLEQACKQVILNVTEKTNSVNYASRIWVETGVAANKKVLPERLDALLNAKVSPVQVGNLFDRYFYETVTDLDLVRSLCSLGERILAVCADQSTVNNIKVKILDGAFITDNFDLAVHMLEQGIPGKDKAWHDMSLPKVNAHRAMAQKKPREAVQYFREFMNAWISSDQKEEFDPTSGIAYSREWILGRNANRIADILGTIPDKAEADKARAEARAYFKIALEKAAGDPEAMKLLKDETKNMGL